MPREGLRGAGVGGLGRGRPRCHPPPRPRCRPRNPRRRPPVAATADTDIPRRRRRRSGPPSPPTPSDVFLHPKSTRTNSTVYTSYSLSTPRCRPPRRRRRGLLTTPSNTLGPRHICDLAVAAHAGLLHLAAGPETSSDAPDARAHVIPTPTPVGARAIRRAHAPPTPPKSLRRAKQGGGGEGREEGRKKRGGREGGENGACVGYHVTSAGPASDAQNLASEGCTGTFGRLLATGKAVASQISPSPRESKTSKRRVPGPDGHVTDVGSVGCSDRRRSSVAAWGYHCESACKIWGSLLQRRRRRSKASTKSRERRVAASGLRSSANRRR